RHHVEQGRERAVGASVVGHLEPPSVSAGRNRSSTCPREKFADSANAWPVSGRTRASACPVEDGDAPCPPGDPVLLDRDRVRPVAAIVLNCDPSHLLRVTGGEDHLAVGREGASAIELDAFSGIEREALWAVLLAAAIVVGRDCSGDD